MNDTKKLGIWMDHASAHIIEYSATNNEPTTVNSTFTHEHKEQSLGKSENIMHHREQHEELAYYKSLGDIIKNYDDVLLFGPTDAKEELFNLLKKQRSFDHIKFCVKSSDKLTEGQQHAFVKNYFLHEVTAV